MCDDADHRAGITADVLRRCSHHRCRRGPRRGTEGDSTERPPRRARRWGHIRSLSVGMRTSVDETLKNGSLEPSERVGTRPTGNSGPTAYMREYPYRSSWPTKTKRTERANRERTIDGCGRFPSMHSTNEVYRVEPSANVLIEKFVGVRPHHIADSFRDGFEPARRRSYRHTIRSYPP